MGACASKKSGEAKHRLPLNGGVATGTTLYEWLLAIRVQLQLDQQEYSLLVDKVSHCAMVASFVVKLLSVTDPTYKVGLVRNGRAVAPNMVLRKCNFRDIWIAVGPRDPSSPNLNDDVQWRTPLTCGDWGYWTRPGMGVTELTEGQYRSVMRVVPSHWVFKHYPLKKKCERVVTDEDWVIEA